MVKKKLSSQEHKIKVGNEQMSYINILIVARKSLKTKEKVCSEGQVSNAREATEEIWSTLPKIALTFSGIHSTNTNSAC